MNPVNLAKLQDIKVVLLPPTVYNLKRRQFYLQWYQDNKVLETQLNQGEKSYTVKWYALLKK